MITRFWWRVVKIIRSNPLLFVALVVGFILRILSTKPGYLSNGDELMYGEAVNMFLKKTLSMHPQWMGYPPLVAWIMLVFFVFIFIPGSWLFYFLSHFQDLLFQFGGAYQSTGAMVFNLKNIFNYDILGKNYINALYWGRYVTAIFGTAAIYAIYKAISNLFNKKVAIITALLAAVNYRLVISSHIGFIDIYNVFFLFLVFWATSVLIKKPNLKSYIVLWVMAALSFLTKYQPYAIFPVLIAHFYISLKAGGGLKGFLKVFFSREVTIGGLIGLVIIIAAHGYHLLNLERVIAINRYEGVKYGFGTNSLNLFPISYLYHPAGVGPFLSVLALVGIAIAFIRKSLRLSSLLLLSPFPLIAFLYFYYSSGGLYTRNLIVMIPIFLVFSAVILVEVLDLAQRQKKLWFKIPVLLVFAILTFFSFKDHLINSTVMMKYYSERSQEDRAKDWLEANVKGNVTLSVSEPRLIPPNKEVKLVPLPHPNTSFSYREMLADKLDYVAINVSIMNNYYFTWWMKQPFRVAKLFWQRPDDLMSQDYKMLALRELLWEHGQAEFLTTWQAPAFNYLVFRIDDNGLCNNEPLVKKESLSSLSWQPFYFLPEYSSFIYKNSDSQMVIKGGRSLAGSVRWQGSSFAVKSGYCYDVSGIISTRNSTKKEERNGFVRLDFYKDNSPTTLTTRPLASFVSERIFGNVGDHPVNIQIVAPQEAKYAAVSFQADNPAVDYTLKKLEVSESKFSAGQIEPTRLFLKDENFFLYNVDGII